MSNALASIMRAATRGDGPLNILTFPTHERYETGLCKTGHNFYAARTAAVKDWDRTYAPVPANYVLLNPARGDKQIPPEVDFDLVLSQNKFGQFELADQFSRQLHLPLVSLEHTLPVPSWGPDVLARLKSMRGDVNVFISEFSRERWGWGPDEAEVVHHGVDTDVFKPGGLLVKKKDHLLSVVNDWVNRDWCCGFNYWRDATRGLPTVVVGKTPGLSEPAKSVPDLVMKYREARVFVNTSLISPIPTALMEAMACGCAVVTTDNCMIPLVVEDGVNGRLASGPGHMRAVCEELLADPEQCARLGQAARRTIVERFSMPAFAASWDRILRRAAAITFTGGQR